MAEEKHLNKPDWTTLTVGAIGFLACLSIGIVLGDAFGLVLGLICGTAFLTAAMYREYAHRPTSIIIEIRGFRMYFRGRTPKFVPWEKIRWIYINPGRPHNLIRKYNKAGMLKLDHVFPYALSYELASAIRQRYLEERGRFPPSHP